MTLQQIREVARLSDGTIARAIGSPLYSNIDLFTEWLFERGNVISYGENALIALYHAAKAFKRQRQSWLEMRWFCKGISR